MQQERPSARQHQHCVCSHMNRRHPITPPATHNCQHQSPAGGTLRRPQRVQQRAPRPQPWRPLASAGGPPWRARRRSRRWLRSAAPGCASGRPAAEAAQHPMATKAGTCRQLLCEGSGHFIIGFCHASCCELRAIAAAHMCRLHVRPACATCMCMCPGPTARRTHVALTSSCMRCCVRLLLSSMYSRSASWRAATCSATATAVHVPKHGLMQQHPALPRAGISSAKALAPASPLEGRRFRLV